MKWGETRFLRKFRYKCLLLKALEGSVIRTVWYTHYGSEKIPHVENMSLDKTVPWRGSIRGMEPKSRHLGDKSVCTGRPLRKGWRDALFPNGLY